MENQTNNKTRLISSGLCRIIINIIMKQKKKEKKKVVRINVSDELF